MSEQLITVGEATQRLGVTSNLPANKCLTKGEFDELVAQIPELAPNGVYIMHKDRFLVKKENWTYSNEEASGVAVKTDNCAFVMAKEEHTSIPWGGMAILINCCVTTTNELTAKSDYRGKQNTDAIVTQLGTGEMYAARYCNEFTFAHGVKGYLPALGELCEAYKSKIEIDACMSTIGGTNFLDNCNRWSSTQYTENRVWLYYEDEIFSDDKIYDYYARPFAAFQ